MLQLEEVEAPNENGFYLVRVPLNQRVAIVFSHVSLKKATVYLTLKQMRTTSSTWL
jgi:hypothetical protein